jgi:centromere/kinetochore protein ZW10
MADLTYLFEEGALVDFKVDELAKLVRALFADTPLRTKTLDKIMGGHPVR